MSVTGGIMAGVGLAGSIGGAAISANAAGDAASQQSAAANNAAQLQYKASQDALDFQKSQFATEQSNLAPFLQSGANGVSSLDYLLGLQQPAGSTATPNTSLGAQGSLLAPYAGGEFKAPTAQDMQQNDPGYQARMQLGDQALQQSAAARGNLLTGGTAQALDAYAQNYASNEYSNYYNQAYNTHAANYNLYQQQQTGTYNKLAALAGMGQQTASTLGTLGQNAASGVSSNLLNTANAMGGDYQNAAAANASGIVGSANAWGGALNGSANNLSNLYMLNSLMGGGGGGTMPGMTTTSPDMG